MKIKLITKNYLKRKEFEEFFSNYGVEIISDGDAKYTMKEETILYDINKNEIINISNLIHLQRVFSKSILTVCYENGEIKQIESDYLEGYINLYKKTNNIDVFGWDDIFILPLSGLSLYEVSKINTKVSCRQKNLSLFALENMHYKERLTTKFNKIEKEETISIDDSVYNFIETNKYLNSPSVKESGIKDLLKKSLKNGAFFRSSKTRREKNYWFPGLNAGIPLVEKADAIHEVTFGVHDLFHFLIPDILFNGDDCKKNRDIYVISRMMSEAIALVLADGWFIQNLKKDEEYDWEKRSIYPLFEKLNLNDKTILTRVIILIINYVLKGEKAYLEAITDNKEAISKFQNKYDPFFVEDYKWTMINYKNMVSQKNKFQHWFISNKKLIQNNLLTVEDINGKDLDELISEISAIFINKIFSKEEFNKDTMISDSFKKYMLGQSFIFSKFNSINITQTYKELIYSSLQKEVLSIEECLYIKGFFKLYIEELHRMNLIDDDQCILYKEIYPLFDPSFAFYDKEKDFYEKSIKDFYNELKLNLIDKKAVYNYIEPYPGKIRNLKTFFIKELSNLIELDLISVKTNKIFYNKELCEEWSNNFEENLRQIEEKYKETYK